MEIYAPIIGAALFLFGACIGSFLNVVIYRLPRHEPILSPHSRSHCPYCGRTLRAVDLVPMLSWLWLRGRCRSCGRAISGRYFMVELVTALLFVGAGWSQGFQPTADLLHELIFIGLAIPIIFIDLDVRLVPDELGVPLLLLGFTWNLVDGLNAKPWLMDMVPKGGSSRFDLSLPISVVSAAACAGVFWLIVWFGEIVFKREAMGLGDVNIAAGVGANLSLLAALCSFGMAIGVGALIGIALMLRRRSRMVMMAFGPMLLPGALLMMLYPGPVLQAVEWYRRSFTGG